METPLSTPHFDIVDKSITVLAALPGVHAPGTRCLRMSYKQAIDTNRQNRGMGNTRLDGMHNGIAGAGITQHKRRGEVGPEPARRVVWNNLGQARCRLQASISTQPLKTPCVE